MKIQYEKAKTLDELAGSHFQIYNPRHGKGDDWHYEYSGLDEALKDGFSEMELMVAVADERVLICREVEG